MKHTLLALAMLSAMLVGVLPAAVIAPDPFVKTLADFPAAPPPEIVRRIGTVENGEGPGRTETSRFTFRSREGANIVFAIVCRPVATSGPRPAILFLHGGGSSAEDKAAVAEHYARLGYVTLACDLPGICGPGKAVHSDGPWRKAPPGESPRLLIEPGAVKSTLVDALFAGLDAFRLLGSLPDVDPARIGVTGQSWGGYTAVTLAGLLGDRVRAVYSVWGSGYFEQGSFWLQHLNKLSPDERDTWLAWLDAGRRAPGITAPLFIEGATNDTYFWPPAVEATLAAAPGAKNRVWWPNLDHAIDRAAAPTRQLFFEHYLKGEGVPFGTVGIGSPRRLPGGGVEFTIQAQVPSGVSIASVRLLASPNEIEWKKRAWTPHEATSVGNGKFVASLPPDMVTKGGRAYAHLADSRGLSVSSAIIPFEPDSH